jgi:hypothetical protein
LESAYTFLQSKGGAPKANFFTMEGTTNITYIDRHTIMRMDIDRERESAYTFLQSKGGAPKANFFTMEGTTRHTHT